MGKPITIARVADRKYTVSVNGYPIGKGTDGKLTFDRAAVGKPASGAPVENATFKRRQDARSVAHQVGRYFLALGDFVDSYTNEVDARAPRDAASIVAFRHAEAV